jgi:hypothetical protein
LETAGKNMIGQFVISRAGHDKGTVYVVTAEEGEFLYLSDGRLKLPDAPKKKRRKHVQPVNRTVEETLRERLAAGEKVEPEAVKRAIKQYKIEANS